MNGLILSYKHFSSHDGPGIRLALFLKGCPLRCQWCHTPESQSGKVEVTYRKNKCFNCGCCEGIFNALPLSSPTEEELTLIGNCPVRAITAAGVEVSAEDVIAQAEKERKFFDESGGGLTISGGEPLFQAGFTLEIARLAKARGISCCIETCGYVDYDKLQKLIPYTELFLYDYKVTDPEKHRELTGVDNALILENLQKLNADGAKIILRCPLIPGVNDQDEHLLAIAAIAEKYENIVTVHVEPFNPMARGKYEELNRPYAEFLPQGFTDAGRINYYLETIGKHTAKKVELP